MNDDDWDNLEKACREADDKDSADFEAWLDEAVLSPEEAQAAFDAAEDVPLSGERIAEIVAYATKGT
jgi:hypothetical protein